MINSNKDTVNISDISILYRLRVATYVRNEFQNLQKGFKIKQIFDLVMFNIEV